MMTRSLAPRGVFVGRLPFKRVYSPLAPTAVQAALEADPVAPLDHLEHLETEIQRVVKRLAAANRAVEATSEQVGVAAG